MRNAFEVQRLNRRNCRTNQPRATQVQSRRARILLGDLFSLTAFAREGFGKLGERGFRARRGFRTGRRVSPARFNSFRFCMQLAQESMYKLTQREAAPSNAVGARRSVRNPPTLPYAHTSEIRCYGKDRDYETISNKSEGK